VEKPDGTLIEIKGKYDLRLRLVNGERLYFTHPVRIEVDGDMLYLTSSDRRRTPVHMGDIEKCSVRQFDTGSTVAALIAVSVVGGLIAGFAVSQQ
jgi:hypothetical protein